MENQRNQVIALVVLIIAWAAYWHFYVKVPHAAVAAKAAEEKAAKADNLLVLRFHRIRAEMDALYHYRINPDPFDAKWNPFRIPKGMEGPTDAGTAAPDGILKSGLTEGAPIG